MKTQGMADGSITAGLVGLLIGSWLSPLSGIALGVSGVGMGYFASKRHVDGGGIAIALGLLSIVVSIMIAYSALSHIL